MSSGARFFEVRLRWNGRIFSRHYQTRTAEQAVSRVKEPGNVISVKKVDPADIIGGLGTMKLDDIIGKPPPSSDAILDNMSITDMLFPKLAKQKRRSESERAKERRKRLEE